MEFTLQDLWPVLPELVVLTMACLVLVVDVYLRDEARIVSYTLAQIGVAAALVASLAVAPGESLTAFNGTFVLDPMATVLKLVIYVVTFGVFVYSKGYLRDRDLFKGEYYVLGLFGMLGMMVMVSAHSLLTVYLGLELLSLSLYAMVAFNRDSLPASEAAIKYFVLGALASGMLLYGMSILYGLTGSLDIARIATVVGDGGAERVPLIFAVTFIVLGMAFKLGAVPFHMWIPDVYHGAPTSVTMYIASAPKIAAFGMVMRVLAESLGGAVEEWSGMLTILAVLSLAVGNVIAIAQTNIKRMLAYSTISHVGFLLLGILAGTTDGYAGAMFYVITYALMSMGAFAMVGFLSRRGFEAERLEDFKGLNERHPWFAAMMLVLMFSMAGVPPTVGFYAKLVVLQAVIEVGMVWLAVVAVAFSIIGLFYYLRVVKLMYFDRAEAAEPVRVGADQWTAMTVNGLAVLGLGIFPGGLLAWCAAALG